MTRARLTLALFGLVVAAVSSSATAADAPADSFVPHIHPTLQVHRAASAIKIDGDLSDAGWQGLQPATDFTEHSPGDEVRPPVRTEAFVTYDDDHLYLSAVCYAPQGTVRASHCERERIFSDDNIGFFFDTYGDASRAYIINLNPYGIPYDALWTPEHGEDQNFDLMFASSGIVTDSGYQVEMAIPLSGLRFPDKAVQNWKFDFYRHHQREVHYSMSWAGYDKKESCWPCKWGSVTGIENVKPGRGVEILPSFVAHQSGTLQDTGSKTTFSNGDVFGDLSIGGKYAVTSDIVVEGTYNPDFSQIESDASQVDVNSTFALSYPEKRPFFQEGMDLFRTDFSAIYTRSINSPDFAAKASANFGRTAFSLVSAHDRQSLGILPFEEYSAYVPLGKTFDNLFAVRRTFGTNNHVRAIVTDQRIDKGGSGTITSLDAALRLTKSIDLRGQFIATHTAEPHDSSMTADLNGNVFDRGRHTAAFDGEKFWGTGFLSALLYNSHNTGASLQAYQRTPTYRAANGFQPRNADRRTIASFNHTFRPSGTILSAIQTYGDAGRIWNWDGTRKNDWVSLQLGNNFRFAQLSMWTSYQASRERFSGVQFNNIWNVSENLNIRPNAILQFGGYLSHGNQVAYDYQRVGRQTSLSLWAELRPVERLIIEPTVDWTHSRDAQTGQLFYDGYIARTRVGYQFSREFSARLVGEYNQFGKKWSVDPLLTYRLNSFSTFYAGATYDYDRLTVLDNQIQKATTRLSARQYFLKIQYLFQT